MRGLLRTLALFALSGAVAAGILGPRDKAPLFTATAVVGDKFEQVSLKQYLDANQWVVLFFYPFDFTFVCPTEIMSFSDKAAEFASKGVQVIGVSCDSHHVHLAWTRTPQADGGLGNKVRPSRLAPRACELDQLHAACVRARSAARSVRASLTSCKTHSRAPHPPHPIPAGGVPPRG